LNGNMALSAYKKRRPLPKPDSIELSLSAIYSMG